MLSQSIAFPSVRRRAQAFLSCLLLALAAFAAVPSQAQSANDPIYVFHTTLGDMRVQLFPDVAPQTVANFLGYVNRGDYNGTFIHRSVPGFVIQGGGYTFNNNTVQTVSKQPAVVNEFHLSNTRGTIAMAKLGGDPNSATDEWFFNLSDSNAANLDNQNGGFTVFGKVVDNASLAVMDAIAALKVTNAGSPFDQLPVRNYTSGTVTSDNLVFLNSVTQLSSNWWAASVSTGADGFTRLLWDRSDGTASVWKVNSAGSIVTQQQYGPYTGWAAKAIATGQDNQTRLLWTNSNGTAAYYLLDANNAFVSQQQYGPYTGWTAQGLAVAPDNSVRALWTNTNGLATVWALDSTNHLTTQQQFGPYTGWTARSLATNPDGTERLLWTNTNGTAAFWKLNSGSQLQTQQQYGPYTGYTASGITAAPDGTGRVVWTATDAHIALWTLDGSNVFTGQQSQFGPYSGFSFTGISVGSDGNARLLWDNITGQAALWSLTPSATFAANTQYGPF